MDPAPGGTASGLRKKVVGTEVADHARLYDQDRIRRSGRPQERTSRFGRTLPYDHEALKRLNLA
jgi:hypothetical protein